MVQIEKRVSCGRGSWGWGNCGRGYSCAKRLAGGGSCGIEKREIPRVMREFMGILRDVKAIK